MRGLWFWFEFFRFGFFRRWRRWVLGFVWFRGDRGCGGWREVFAEMAEIHECVAELTVEGHLVAADEFDAGDIVAVGGDGGVMGLCVGMGGRRLVGEGLPGFDEMESGVVGGAGVPLDEVGFLDSGLGVDEGGFEAYEAGLTPLNGRQLVDEGLLGVGIDLERGAELGDVFLEGGFVFDFEDDVDDGGEPMFEGIGA